MKLPNKDQFEFKDCVIAGDECWLIYPKKSTSKNPVDIKWDNENARFRSCIVRKEDNFVVSQGFKKFTNYGESPDFEPWGESWKFEVRHKMDGSLLIVSKHKGELVIRTRGTVDARNLANGHEIDFLIEKYPEAFNNPFVNEEKTTLLFEWTTPTNVIVVREHSEPTLTLLGMIHNEYGIYQNQWFLDLFAESLNLPRPKKYEYNSIKECMSDVDAWTGSEGVIMYSPNYQVMKKFKSQWYCSLHHMATGICTVRHVLTLFMASPRYAKYSDFYHYVEVVKDHEIAEKVKDFILEVCVAYSKVLEKVEKVKRVVEHVRTGFSRREQALEFQQNYNDWRLGAAFAFLDGKGLEDKTLLKALEQELGI